MHRAEPFSKSDQKLSKKISGVLCLTRFILCFSMWRFLCKEIFSANIPMGHCTAAQWGALCEIWLAKQTRANDLMVKVEQTQRSPYGRCECCQWMHPEHSGTMFPRLEQLMLHKMINRQQNIKVLKNYLDVKWFWLCMNVAFYFFLKVKTISPNWTWETFAGRCHQVLLL